MFLRSTRIARHLLPCSTMRSLIWAGGPCPFDQPAAWCERADEAVGATHRGVRFEFPCNFASIVDIDFHQLAIPLYRCRRPGNTAREAHGSE